MFLHIAADHGDATNHNLEFGGPGLASVPMNDRRTIATQGAEVSADFTVFGVDERCEQFLAAPGAGPYQSVEADPDAATPTSGPSTSAASSHRWRSRDGQRQRRPGVGARVPKIDQCFVGSCANGQLEDLRIAAELLDGRQVAEGVRLIVTPASQAVYREALRRGYLAAIADSGAVVTNSTCGACFGYHMGVVGDGEVCLTSSTRNFRGRMGSPSADIYMASTATVVASAVAGHLVDARETGR